jgi:Leucine-rich repeat (LRR) protein
MKRLSVLPIFVLLIYVCSCKKKDQVPVNSPPPDSDIIADENNRLSSVVTSQTITAFISGTIRDEDGKGLVGVSVTAGSVTGTTNDKGYFQFPSSVAVNEDYAVLTASLDGYFKAIRTFTPNPSGKANHYFEIRLLKPATEKTVAAGGGNVVLDNKVDIMFPDAAVVTSAGAAYNGQYRVSARYIDPESANFLETMPGMLAGLNDQNQLQALQSFGMAIVELKDATGNSLKLAPGKKATLKLPAPANGPSTIPLWHFNEKYGLWIQAGVATKTGDSYTAEVNHFSTWNLDLEFNSFKLDLQFKDQLGNAVSGLHVEAHADGGNKIKSFYTDNEGKATLINCPTSTSLILKTIFQCDTVLKTLDPITASRSETVMLPNSPGVKVYTIAGKISGCDNAPLTNQPFKIAIEGDAGNIGLPGVTDAQGNYSVTGMMCNNSIAITAQASAFINNEYRYAPAVNITLASSTYNAQVCDTAGIADNFEIVFPDPALNSLIRKKINKPMGAILYSDVKNIDSLVSFDPIGDISGLQFCTNLKVLDLREGASISDLGPVKNLLSLREFYINAENGSISDISPLQNLTQLQSLSLDCPNLSDILPLQNLVHLQGLSIWSNKLSDLSPLRDLTELTWLQLIADAVSDLTPLQNLTQLTSFEVDSRLLTSSNLATVQNFTQLYDLWIRGTTISDFSVVKNLPGLLYLHLDRNQISDVSQFTSLTHLISLELGQNQITDISPLQTMTQLQYLKLSNNQISDISSLKNIKLAITLDLHNNLITDLSPLQGLDSLQVLWLQFNNITDITPLINGSFPDLVSLMMASQQQGKITQAQQDAFKANHPNCTVSW